jgi:magnesium-transporting ATPase (P-type)
MVFALAAGDKVETAISIAYSCQLFADQMQIVEVREQEVHEMHEEHGDQGVVQVRCRGVT